MVSLHPFSARFMNLMNLYDNEKALAHDARIHMYEELLLAASDCDMIKDLVMGDILVSLRAYCDELVATNNYYVIYKFENSFSKWMHIPAKTVYHNPQNVHVFMTPAAKAAAEIMRKHPQVYNHRPFEHPFFDAIETNELVNGIHLPSLFASVWFYMSTHKERHSLIERLREEMKDSSDMCLSGHMVRLVNSVKGYDDAFDFNLEQYEYDKANIFNQLNKLLDVTLLENLLNRMANIVNNDSLFKYDGIDPQVVAKILQDYSKQTWSWATKFIYTI